MAASASVISEFSIKKGQLVFVTLDGTQSEKHIEALNIRFLPEPPVLRQIPYTAKGIKNSDGKFLASKGYDEDGKHYIEFYADPVPAFGYGVFTLCDETAEFDTVKATKNSLENKYLKITLDDSGCSTR